MSNRKRSERRQQRQAGGGPALWPVRLLRERGLNVGVSLRTAAIALFLVGSAVALGIALVSQSGGRSDDGGSAQRQEQQSVGTGTPGPTLAAGWIGAKSTQPADIIAAARATSTFQAVLVAQSPLGNALRTGTLGTPVLVHAYRPAPGMLDTWVIPVLQKGTNHVVALLDFAYDQSQQRLHATAFAGPFVSSDPAYGQPFPRLSTTDALSQTQSKRGISPAAGTQPHLIYFPIDLDKTAGPRPTIRWTGGGQFADTAIWLVHGSDGKDYLVGNDGQVYTPDQLPLSPLAGK